MSNLIKGVDVSRWQGTSINWNQVKADGYLFSFMKATDGSAYKQQFVDIGKLQASQAKNAGLKIGYYHFAHPTNYDGLLKDAQAEANYFIATIKTFPKPNFPLVLDFEDEKMALTPQEAENWIKEFKTIVNNAGYELILYSYASYLDKSLSKSHQLGGMPLWLASYPKVVDLTKYPKKPRGWASWIMWQYSEKGKPKGFTATGCDLNVMTKVFFDHY